MSKNDITGDALKSRPNSKAYDDNFDKIFKKVCPRCNGFGWHKGVSKDSYLYDERCTDCGGSGRISK